MMSKAGLSVTNAIFGANYKKESRLKGPLNAMMLTSSATKKIEWTVENITFFSEEYSDLLQFITLLSYLP